jgi:hypothetical protein
MTTGIAIAFEMVEYTVSESTGKIEVTVSVVSTNLIFAPITVQLFSSEQCHGSAKGTVCHQRFDQSIPEYSISYKFRVDSAWNIVHTLLTVFPLATCISTSC